MTNNTNRQRDSSKEGEDDEHDDSAEGQKKVLPNNPPGTLAQTERSEKIFEPIMHEDYVGLLERSIRGASAHGDTDVSSGQAWRVIHAVADHGNALAGDGHGMNFRELFFRLKFSADVVNLQLGPEMFRSGLAITC